MIDKLCSTVYTHTSMLNPDPTKEILEKISKGVIPNGEHYIDPSDEGAKARYLQESQPKQYYPEGITSNKLIEYFTSILSKELGKNKVDIISLCSGGAIKESKMAETLNVQDVLISDISPYLVHKAIENFEGKADNILGVNINFQNPGAFEELKNYYHKNELEGESIRIHTLLGLTIGNESQNIVQENLKRISNCLNIGDKFIFDCAIHKVEIRKEVIERKYSGRENIAGIVSFFESLGLKENHDFSAYCKYVVEDGYTGIKQVLDLFNDTVIEYEGVKYPLKKGENPTRVSLRFRKDNLEKIIHNAGLKISGEKEIEGRLGLLTELL